MKALFVLTLALAAAVIAEDTEVLLLKEAGVHDIEVPKDGNFSLKFVITNETAHKATGGPDLSIHITFRTTSIKRENHVFVGPNFTSMSGDIFDEDGDHTFKLDTFPNGCVDGCEVFIKIRALCDSMSCINSISTRIWARLVHRTSGAYVFSNNQVPYMPIYRNKWSPEIIIEKSKYYYFEYFAESAGELRVAKDSTVGSALLVLSGKDTIIAPRQDKSEWVQLEDSNYEEFVAGTNYLGLYGGETMPVISTEGRICVGECETSPASTLVPAVLFLLVSAFAALF